jgi:hypothetical protein
MILLVRGVAWSRLNSHTFKRRSELMFQTYYQAQVYNSIYFQSAFSYIPNPVHILQNLMFVRLLLDSWSYFKNVSV